MNTIFWFRRDLRLEDNVGLHNALKNNENVIPIFIFDKNIIADLPNDDKRITFIHKQLKIIKEKLNRIGSDLLIFHSTPISAFESLTNKYDIKSVYTNRDYEPYAKKRDKEIEKYLIHKSIEFHSFKDQVIFEKDEIVKDNGEPYLVFTPYSKVWKEHLSNNLLRDNSIRAFKENFFNQEIPDSFPTLAEIGFNEANIHIPPINIDENIIRNYHNSRDYPHIEGTSNMSVHLRFGTISIRQLISKTKSISENYLNELIWREFFMSILYHFPETVTDNFHRKYDKVEWRNDEKEFELWCKGQTGFPLVDAGMRELNETGFMHNRVRMVVANFLTKLLLIDWRWGEEYFAEKLLDFELSSNVGNWQWSAGTGVDAAPYFRIFNPQLQIERFDPDYIYIKKWIDNYNENYLEPIVDYKKARELCINTFKKALYND